MRFTVVWVPTAITELARLWTDALDRQAVTSAADRIDETLRDDPEAKTIPFGRLYALAVEPLAVLCEIDPGDCMVRVVQVRRIEANGRAEKLS
jgi:hypothetical protein